jgi:hypothetical protein
VRADDCGYGRHEPAVTAAAASGDCGVGEALEQRPDGRRGDRLAVLVALHFGAALAAEDCLEVQGYLFSRPRPASEVPDMIARFAGPIGLAA